LAEYVTLEIALYFPTMDKKNDEVLRWKW